MCQRVSVAAGLPRWASSIEMSPTIPMRKVPPALGCADGFAAAALAGVRALIVGAAGWTEVTEVAAGLTPPGAVAVAAGGGAVAGCGAAPHAVSSAVMTAYTPNCNAARRV